MATNEYEEQILRWQAKKLEERIGENGWMALAGLFWLNQGRNLIGSNPMCEVTLPERGPTFLGLVELKGKVARLQIAEGVHAQVNGKLTKKTILKTDHEPKPSYITWNDIRMVIHEYAGKYAMRVWDNERRHRFTLPLLKWFPINKQFRFQARYTRYPEPKVSSQPDAFGEAVDDRLDGYVTFKYEGMTYKLESTEQADGRLFIKFRDLTSTRETYPASRYHYTEPVNGDKVIVDFNYSYSPPCAFTEFATCLFASQQNTLPFRVEAGEIYRG